MPFRPAAHDGAVRHAAAACAPSRILAKLRIGPVDDPLEREADRAADAVMRGEAAGVTGAALARPQRVCTACGGSTKEGRVQRKCAACAHEGGGRDAEKAARAVSGGGAPMSPELRAYFEPRFERDLSGVRIHAGGRAGRAADTISARAFTVGNDIGFAAGEYAPQRTEGRRLIAHELAHVAQQGAGPATVRRQPAAPPATPPLEIVPAGGTGTLTTDQRRAAASCDIDCSGASIGTLHAMPLSFHTLSGASAVAGTAAPAGVGAMLHFIRHATTPAAGNACANCTAFHIIQVVNTNLPAATRSSNSYVDNDARQGVAYYDSVAEGHPGPHAIPEHHPDAGRQVDTAISIYDRPSRLSADLAASLREDFYWNAEACVTCARTSRDLILGCATYGFRRPWDSATTSHGPVQAVGPGCLTMPSPHFIRTLRGDSTTSSYDFETFRPASVEFRSSLGLASTLLGASQFMSLTGLIGIGIPLEQQRRAMIDLGVFGQWLTANERERDAYMLGLRAGVEGRTRPERVGFTGTLFGAGGVMHRPEGTDPAGATLPARTSGFGEVGLGAGLNIPIAGQTGFQLRAEGAFGVEITPDPDALQWFRTGLTIGVSH